MPYIANRNSVTSTWIVCSHPGDKVQDTIAIALKIVAKPETAYSYFDHNGVIVTLDKNSTAESAYEEWSKRLEIMCDTFYEATNKVK